MRKKRQDCDHISLICRIKTGEFCFTGSSYLIWCNNYSTVITFGWLFWFRNMLGESLGALSLRDLKNLETKVERGISRIRSKKVPINIICSCILVDNLCIWMKFLWLVHSSALNFSPLLWISEWTAICWNWVHAKEGKKLLIPVCYIRIA